MKLRKNTGIKIGFLNYFTGPYAVGYYYQPIYLKVYFDDNDVEVGYEEYDGKTFYI